MSVDEARVQSQAEKLARYPFWDGVWCSLVCLLPTHPQWNPYVEPEFMVTIYHLRRHEYWGICEFYSYTPIALLDDVEFQVCAWQEWKFDEAYAMAIAEKENPELCGKALSAACAALLKRRSTPSTARVS